MKKFLLFIFLAAPSFAFAQLIPSDVMPFGSDASADSDAVILGDSCINKMRLELGFNQFRAGFDSAMAGRWADSGIYVYTGGNKSYTELSNRYSNSIFFICHPDSCVKYGNANQCRYDDNVGTVIDNYLVWNGSGYLIQSYPFGLENIKHWYNPPGEPHRLYYLHVKMGRGSIAPDSNTVIGTFWVESKVNGIWQTRFTSTVRAAQLAQVPNDQLIYLADSTGRDNFTLSDSSSFDLRPETRFWLSTTGVCSVFVDYIMLHDEGGGQLMCPLHQFQPTIDNIISKVIRPNWDGRLLGWQLAEPVIPKFRSISFIDKLINSATIDSGWNYPVRGNSYFCGQYFSPYMRDYAQIMRAPHQMFFLYPYDRFTNYTGYSQNDSDYFQTALNIFIANPCDTIRQLISEVLFESWTFMPQFWFCLPESSCTTDHEYFRKPTPSELRCQSFMGLCYHPKGFLPWKYNTKCETCNRGMVDVSGNRDEWLYNTLRDDINPYIKAIDSIYLSLEWERAYACSAGVPIYPGSNNFVSSINAISNSADSLNPDLGWFHVGEFFQGGAKYVLIVNRACSQYPDSSIEAPSITAKIQFNPGNLGLGDYVYITDLAKSVRLAGGDSGFVGIPEVTYSAKMPDGKIPFITTLRAGEGRLFKISQAPVAQLSGMLNTSVIYQGRMAVIGDAIIPLGQTMEIKGPALFEFYRCDSESSGKDTNLVELIIDGVLKARGTQTDSIWFQPDTLIDCDIALVNNPVPGDWYGIRDRSDGHDTLSFCSIKFAYTGFGADPNCNATLRHCFISRCEYIGFSAYNTCADTAMIDSCYFKNNKMGGISATGSLFFARGNILEDAHEKAAININGKPCGVTTLAHQLTDNFIRKGSGTSAYGIKITGSSSSRPSVLLSGNTIRGFGSGVYLYYCQAGAWSPSTSGTCLTGGNVIDSNTYYGVYCSYQSSPAIFGGSGDCLENNRIQNNTYGLYCTSSSSPKVSQAIFDYNQADVWCASASSPNLGDSVSFWGSNQLYSDNFNIWNATNPLIIVKAMGNWFDSIPPDPLRFYPTISAVNVRHYRNRLTDPPCESSLAPRIALNSLLPAVFVLHPNYPNPFNPSTNISFDLPADSKVRIAIYNILGQRIRTVADESFMAGNHLVRWDGRNESGSEVCSGLYFAIVETGSDRATQKMLLLR